MAAYRRHKCLLHPERTKQLERDFVNKKPAGVAGFGFTTI
jgi:hypothetical protein